MTDGELAQPSDEWNLLRMYTPARIGLGIRGASQPTHQIMKFNADHATARDAVRVPLNVAVLSEELSRMGFETPNHVRSSAATREDYLRRPDLGRRPADIAALQPCSADVGIVIADGLSARAVQSHAVALTVALVDALSGRYRLAPITIATQARVALGDHVGEALGIATVLVIIGERPGLSVADSLGIYLTHHPRPGRTDAERNCISNIHPPDGLTFKQAAAVCARLLDGARRLGRSGVDLKDTSRTGLPEALDAREMSIDRAPLRSP